MVTLGVAVTLFNGLVVQRWPEALLVNELG